MNDDPGNNIQQEDLISDDVANAITSAMKGEEMTGAATPAATVQPSQHKSAPAMDGSSSGGPAPAQSNQAAHDDTPPAGRDDAQPTPQPVPEPYQPSPPPAGPAADDSQTDMTNRGSGNVSELYDIKQQALKQLGPLVQHLDQGPEEKFETLIMMLRASDDPALIQPAYEAAQTIADDKKRAQALLDVVNEVNYLTRPQDSQD